eukprot:TRINITY_DN1978_c1_g1_i1.p2 TRINITY_DN1978_c1_g1~~TRINITY_DN1978_c1_g1_i1.p2  ORF type:complete len:135 (+),score=50.32 TRINITY_DN1978_c1_g1_i1:97-501(+)
MSAAGNCGDVSPASSTHSQEALLDAGLRRRTTTSSLPTLLKAKVKTLRETVHRQDAKKDDADKRQEGAGTKTVDSMDAKDKVEPSKPTPATRTTEASASSRHGSSSAETEMSPEMADMMKVFEKCMVEPGFFGM